MLDNVKETPSRLDVVKDIAKHFKTKENLVVIKHMYPQFGAQQTKLIVHIYGDKDKMNLFEHKNLLKKHQEPKAEKPVQTVEQPTLEQKEEPKPEQSKTRQSKPEKTE